VQTPEGLKDALYDKIYYTLDEDLHQMLLDHPEKYVATPNLPQNYKEIIDESTKLDNDDESLKTLIDQIVKTNIYNKWFESLYSNDRVDISKMPIDFQKGIYGKVKEIADLEYNHYEDHKSHGFSWRNKALLEQTSVSSALFVEYNWLPYYQYKLGENKLKDAKKYLEGLKSIMPIVKKDDLNAYSIEEIIKIRKSARWDKAMDKMAELCNESKYNQYSDRFKDDIIQKVIMEYQNALDAEEITLVDLGKDLTKNTAFTAIGFIPFVGPVASGAAGYIDPLVNYIRKTEAQRTLPFFLNDLKRI